MDAIEVKLEQKELCGLHVFESINLIYFSWNSLNCSTTSYLVKNGAFSGLWWLTSR